MVIESVLISTALPGREAPMTRAASRPVPRSGNQAVVPATVDDLLIEARGGLARLDPVAAFRAIRRGAVLVDTRPQWQRRAGGEIPVPS